MSKRWDSPRFYTPKPKEKTEEDYEYGKIIGQLTNRNRKRREDRNRNNK